MSKFEVFAGWKPTEDIKALFRLDPLRSFVPDKIAQFDNETLRHITQALLQASNKDVLHLQEKLAALPKDAYGTQSYIPGLLPRLQQQFSKEDAGNLVALLCMNYMVLSPGDAIYIPADGIHAYLSGDIVECMARSNNVLNTGFCPRADRDNVELFSAALTFGPHSPDDVKLPSRPSDKGKHGKTVVYAPPMSEFDMLLTTLASGEIEVRHFLKRSY